MDIKQIRNATIVVQYAGKKLLVDPMLSEKGTMPSFGEGVGFPPAPRQDQNNPLVSLPASIDHIIADLDAVLVTHLHPDHWDEAAVKALPKELKLFVQNGEDANVVTEAGFTNVEVLTEDTMFGDIQFIKTKGEHGRGPVLELAGQVCGVVFKHPSEKTLYLAGDTVWNGDVQGVIETHNPEIIVVAGGDNQFLEGGSLVMGKNDIYEVYKAAPNAKIISNHMEAVNHWTLSREELKNFSNEKGMSDNILVPDDGDTYTF